MTKAYEQMCRECRKDMEADGLYDMTDSTVFYDIAEAMLYDPEFKKEAKKKFPTVSDQILRECVADSIFSA